jgi:hypothetical protein
MLSAKVDAIDRSGAIKGEPQHGLHAQPAVQRPSGLAPGCRTRVQATAEGLHRRPGGARRAQGGGRLDPQPGGPHQHDSPAGGPSQQRDRKHRHHQRCAVPLRPAGRRQRRPRHERGAQVPQRAEPRIRLATGATGIHQHGDPGVLGNQERRHADSGASRHGPGKRSNRRCHLHPAGRTGPAARKAGELGALHPRAYRDRSGDPDGRGALPVRSHPSIHRRQWTNWPDPQSADPGGTRPAGHAGAVSVPLHPGPEGRLLPDPAGGDRTKRLAGMDRLHAPGRH